jgi:hypothetical protein
MTSSRYAPTDDRLALPLEGFVVKAAWYDKTDSGYPYVRIEFTNGEVLTAEEIGQVGDINVSIDNPEK